jgi:8-oxo-dGTP pyrophosphatase MutT (NUDIX family)
MSLDALAAALAAFVPREAPVSDIASENRPRGGFHRAAVLVPLHDKDGEPHVLLTRRQRHLRNHPGQIAFPGGKLDPDEEHLAAALREAREEIGLSPADARVLGRLSEALVLTTPFRLTPWVASVPYPYPWAPQPGEVEDLLHVPLAALLARGAHRTERREAYGMLIDVHWYYWRDEAIWGATARILFELLTLWRSL